MLVVEDAPRSILCVRVGCNKPLLLHVKAYARALGVALAEQQAAVFSPLAMRTFEVRIVAVLAEPHSEES